jgi:ferredoxin
MTIRKIIKIDEEKCNGCGLCVPSCAEGALQIVDGKARLVGEVFCDGLGACLGDCPEGAIIIEEREAEGFDEAAVAERMKQEKAKAKPQAQAPSGGCPGSRMRQFTQAESEPSIPQGAEVPSARSQLCHWPVQLTLLPPQGEIWNNADVLIAADCVPFAMPDFHQRLLAGKTVAVGCPKLDDLNAYVEKLTHIFTHNSVRSVTVAHMEVPCCSGIVTAAQKAIELSGRSDIEFKDVKVSVQGAVCSELPCGCG